ncbi:MAG: carbohydrate kinase family protein [Clostridia bacterium]|nr:carbohydrate kinase family protein [Oscillospiraceae bacterium]MBQ7032173.1 carbohydrate kinase family protein [Clostridia bacterium]
MIDIACVGILVADLIAKPVDSIPKAGLLERIDSIAMYSGGCAMNAAIDMAKIGLKTAVLGKVGADSFGDFLRDELKKYNVETDGVATDNKVQTSASVVISASSGERSFLHTVGANATFCYDDVNWDIVEKSRIVFVAGTMLMDAFDGPDCARVLKKCKEMGKVTVLDTAWDSRGRWMDVLEPCMPYIDVFMPSIDEAIELAGGEREPSKIADIFFDMGVRQVVIKLGSQGCYLRESKEAEGVTIPCFTVKAVDTTGAGDSFCAGFLSGMAKGLSFTECGRFANAVGAHCVQAMGASTGIRSYEEIQTFILNQEKN